MAITISFEVSSASTISSTTQSVSVLLTGTASMGGPYTYPNVPVYQGSTQVGTVNITPVDSAHCEFSMAGLQEETSYKILAGSYEDSSSVSGIYFPLDITFSTTADETPRTATDSQWQDLAARVKAKADQASVNGDTETYSIAPASWSAVTGADPFTYTATVTATHTITANTIAELYNDNAVAFATYGFAIASINGQTVTIYALDTPTAAVSLKINYKEVS